MLSRKVLLLSLVGLIAAPCAQGAIISSATGKRTIKTGGTYRITTTTRGQRQIIITVDPSITTAFRVDVTYPSAVVSPAGFAGFNAALSSTAIEYIPPYGNPNAFAAQVSPKGTDGVISNIQGELIPSVSPPQPNNGTGGSDLFRLTFDDRDPTQDKIFTILGFDSKGIAPDVAGLVSDNFIDAIIDDPNDPLNGQVYHFNGRDIEQGIIFVPGERGGGVGQVPVPAAVWGGMTLGAALLVWHAKRQRLSAVCV